MDQNRQQIRQMVGQSWPEGKVEVLVRAFRTAGLTVKHEDGRWSTGEIGWEQRKLELMYHRQRLIDAFLAHKLPVWMECPLSHSGEFKLTEDHEGGTLHPMVIRQVHEFKSTGDGQSRRLVHSPKERGWGVGENGSQGLHWPSVRVAVVVGVLTLGVLPAMWLFEHILGHVNRGLGWDSRIADGSARGLLFMLAIPLGAWASPILLLEYVVKLFGGRDASPENEKRVVETVLSGARTHIEGEIDPESTTETVPSLSANFACAADAQPAIAREIIRIDGLLQARNVEPARTDSGGDGDIVVNVQAPVWRPSEPGEGMAAELQTILDAGQPAAGQEGLGLSGGAAPSSEVSEYVSLRNCFIDNTQNLIQKPAREIDDVVRQCTLAVLTWCNGEENQTAEIRSVTSRAHAQYRHVLAMMKWINNLASSCSDSAWREFTQATLDHIELRDNGDEREIDRVYTQVLLDHASALGDWHNRVATQQSTAHSATCTPSVSGFGSRRDSWDDVEDMGTSNGNNGARLD